MFNRKYVALLILVISLLWIARPAEALSEGEGLSSVPIESTPPSTPSPTSSAEEPEGVPPSKYPRPTPETLPEESPTSEALALPGPEGNDMWTWRGIQHNTGLYKAPQVNEIVIDPKSPNIVYAATNQGVYRSIDSGETWEPRNNGLGGYGDLVVTDLAIDPVDSTKLMISTWGYGMLSSTDSGENWTRVNDPVHPSLLRASGEGETPLPLPIIGGPSYNYRPKEEVVEIQGEPQTWQRTAMRCVTIHPGNPNEIYACVDDGVGLFKSTDGGNSWSEITTIGSGSSRTYTFAPSNHNIRYASFGTWSTPAGFYRTTNGGSSWTEMGSGTILGTVIDVAIHPTNPNIVLVGTSGDGVYRTTDGGSTWAKVSSGLGDSTFFSVAFAPSDPTIAYAGGYTWVYMSTDGGANWTNADTTFPTFYVDGLAIHPTDPGTVLAGTNDFPYGGVYKRTSSGQSFALKPDGMNDTFVLDIEQDPNNSSTLYAATWGAGVFRSYDGGNNWHELYLNVPYVYSIHAAKGPTSTILYAATFYSDYGIMKSFDQGDTWFEVSRTYPSYISLDLDSIYGDPDHLVAATYDGMTYSYDGGQNWYSSGGLDEGIVLHLCEFGDTGRLLASTYGGGLFYSWGGYSWYEANVGVPTTYPQYQYTYDVACSPNVTGRAYAGGLGIYRSEDYGEHWRLSSVGLPNDYVRAVDVLPGTEDIFAATNSNGVYFASYGKEVWQPINTGLHEQRTRAIEGLSSYPPRAIVGTNGRGAWDYTVLSRPLVSSVYLPTTLRGHPSITCQSYEFNNSSSEAYALPGSGTYCSYVDHSSDRDYYRINVTSLGTIQIDLTEVPLGNDYDVALYNSTLQYMAGSDASGNSDEQILFHPVNTGYYYILITSASGSSATEGYHLTTSYNGSQGSGLIYGTVTDDGAPASNTLVRLQHYNGYRTVWHDTLTNNSGVYRFRGLDSLPIGHYYAVNYPNMESDSGRLAYWWCYDVTEYTAGSSVNSCDFDVENINLLAPSTLNQTLPTTFQWSTRGIAGEDYYVYLRRYSPSYAYFFSPTTTGGSYTLSSLPSGFSYGPTNYWSVSFSNSNGYGASYYMRSIIFDSTTQRAQGADYEELRNLPCTDLPGEGVCRPLDGR